MNTLIFVGLIFISTAFAAEWSEWTETPDSICSKDCGMCGTRVTAERTCPTPGQCVGSSEQTGACPPKMCLFPQRTCCKGYRKGLTTDYRLACIPREGWFTEASTTDQSTSTTESSTTTSS
ncbi:hypothetical protein PRIPAC_74182 [Pristionchus pacificus]|uniref:Uncharacterized protein n=1 Tax=Pristionchus pacificus TaxID=54126 RepID=A0A454XZP1_PRIPA|nr:hypothetical protein PRIPAC_74182 [Pristionchus pacificus]|eukprot:PDM73820.1 hypothetical protein PRIPAC_41176 [Pristionchus pacificus]